ncbi:hypothetical protein [Tenuifilum thalassicum]|uniref:Uncharacterized protein n=1 Tax=Tenuifilum thalassicum TaxID=2590900 RepID=A0A7D4BD22_9BACT|nr:hypothetical protein [Tenuifilum thalassicum]QKG79303.1 hypothetical protein FHG85_03170 [Tenuifilum thalassicum]
MRKITLIMLFLLSAKVGLSQLWLTEDELIKRYGKPIEKGYFEKIPDLDLYYLIFDSENVNKTSEYKCEYLKAFLPIDTSIVNYCFWVEAKYPIKYIYSFIENYNKKYSRPLKEDLKWIDYNEAVWHYLYITAEEDYFLAVDMVDFELLIREEKSDYDY